MPGIAGSLDDQAPRKMGISRDIIAVRLRRPRKEYTRPQDRYSFV